MLFIETAETLKTINLVPSLGWGNWPLTFVLAFLCLILVAIVIFLNQAKVGSANWRLVILFLIIVGFLPVGLNNLLVAYRDITVLGPNMKTTIIEKAGFRLCTIDANQKLENQLCGISDFYKQVKEIVPIGQKVALASNGIYDLVLRNYLLPDYGLVALNNEDLNYFLIYLTPNKYQIASGGDLLELQANGQTINYGRFEIIRILNQSIAILKKI